MDHEVHLNSEVSHFLELSKHKLNSQWYGPLRGIVADAQIVKLRTPLERQFHCRVHVSACKLYHRDDADLQPALPDSQIDKENYEIKEIVGHRWSSDPRRKEFRVRFMHLPHDNPAYDHDEWFARANL